MKNVIVLLLMMMSILVSSCTNKEQEQLINKQKAQIEGFELKVKQLENQYKESAETIENLKAEIQKYQTNPAKLMAEADKAFAEKDTLKLKNLYKELHDYHIESPETVKAEKLLTNLRNEYLKIQKAREAKERAEAAAEERRNPHTPGGLAKKAAKGGTIIGVWQMSVGVCVTIIERNGRFYMYNLYTQSSSIGDPDRLLLLGDGVYRYAEEETGETFVARPDGLYAYAYGSLSSVWMPVW